MRNEIKRQGRKKTNLQYWFTVEGNTEEWYLEHVQKLINSVDAVKKHVVIEPKICKSPKSFVKNMNALITPRITHLCDIESKSQEHLGNFSNVLSELQFARKNKEIQYEIGYSNYTFDLWIILHKQQLMTPLSDRTKYLPYINSAYSKNFNSLSEYKEKDSFKKVLDCIDIDSIKLAIQNAEAIEDHNMKIGAKSKNEYGEKYYIDNPALSIHRFIRQIFEDCGLLEKKK